MGVEDLVDVLTMCSLVGLEDEAKVLTSQLQGLFTVAELFDTGYAASMRKGDAVTALVAQVAHVSWRGERWGERMGIGSCSGGRHCGEGSAALQ